MAIQTCPGWRLACVSETVHVPARLFDLYFKCEPFTCVVGNPVHSTVFLFTLMIKVDEAYLKH